MRTLCVHSQDQNKSHSNRCLASRLSKHQRVFLRIRFGSRFDAPIPQTAGREVFGPIEGFGHAQRERRIRQLASYLRERVRDPAERAAVRAAILPDLRRLDIPADSLP